MLMSKDIIPEVGDIFERIDETKVSNRRITSIYKCCDGDCLIHLAYLDEDNRISEEVIFLSAMNKHYKYLGKSKANINDLFTTENEE